MNYKVGIIDDKLIYSSAKIYDRRRRILEETRHLVAEYGYDGFSIRELSHRAKVAPQTIYKAFENKERLIALAIRHYYLSYAQKRQYRYEAISLQGVIERIIANDENMRQMRKYVSAIISIYFSQTADPDLRQAASTNVVNTLQPWIASLRENGFLRRGIGSDTFLNGIISMMFKVALDWSRGEISNEDFLDLKLQTLLTYGAGATRGAGNKEICTYLTDQLGRRELIRDITEVALLHKIPPTRSSATIPRVRSNQAR